jgi:hypothetical protein
MYMLHNSLLVRLNTSNKYQIRHSGIHNYGISTFAQQPQIIL